MNRLRIVSLALAAAIPLGAAPLFAQSTPVVAGDVAGLEVAPQFLVGAAVFVGEFRGRVGSNTSARGAFYVAAKHDALPDEVGDVAAITGGNWYLLSGFRFLRGTVESGAITNIGNNEFAIVATLRLTGGGTGRIYFAGILDHNPLFNFPPRPPTLVGELSQSP
ncbi:MAG: hypothetical protein HYS13_05435 [Planctomycetia bacterium]|nr:hypothetical protein [Planctomycetia bacterium]